MNETIRTIMDRRSIRRFKPDPVPNELVSTIVDCGQVAPNGMGWQNWHFTVIESRAFLDKIALGNTKLNAAGDGPMKDRAQAELDAGRFMDNFYGAPMAIILSGGDACGAANACQNICLAAQSLGLGTCYLGSFKPIFADPAGAELLSALELPEGYEPLYAIAVGYPDFTPEPRAPRKEGAVSYIR